MDCVEEVLEDIRSRYGAYFECTEPFKSEDLVNIQSTLQELDMMLSNTVVQYFSSNPLRSGSPRRQTLNLSTVPETPLQVHSKHQSKLKEIQNNQRNGIDDQPLEEDSDDSFVFSVISRNPAKPQSEQRPIPNTQNLNVFSFGSNDTQFSNITIKLNHVPDTQMDVDDLNFSTLSPVLNGKARTVTYGENNDVTLSQSFLELNLAESEQNNSTNGGIYNFERVLGYDINRKDDDNEMQANNDGNAQNGKV